MSYVPLPEGVLVPGLEADRYVARLIKNVDAACELYVVSVLSCATMFVTDNDTPQLAAEFIVPGNIDNQRLVLMALWRGENGSKAELKFTIKDGLTEDSASMTSTTSAYTIGALALDPVNTVGISPYGRLGQIHISIDGGGVVHVDHLLVLVAPNTYPAGALPSGAAKVAGWDLTPNGCAWPSELVQRLSSNIRAVARDRRACLASGLNRAGSGGVWFDLRPNYEVTGKTFKCVERFLWPGGDVDPRKLRIALNLGGTNPEVRLQLGSYDLIVTDIGWHHDTPILHLPRATPGYLYVRSTTGHTAKLLTFQIFREPR